MNQPINFASIERKIDYSNFPSRVKIVMKLMINYRKDGKFFTTLPEDLDKLIKLYYSPNDPIYYNMASNPERRHRIKSIIYSYTDYFSKIGLKMITKTERKEIIIKQKKEIHEYIIFDFEYIDIEIKQKIPEFNIAQEIIMAKKLIEDGTAKLTNCVQHIERGMKQWQSACNSSLDTTL